MFRRLRCSLEIILNIWKEFACWGEFLGELKTCLYSTFWKNNFFNLSKEIRIVIVDDEDYEKKETFQVSLGQPYVVTADGEQPPPSPGGNSPEEERIRELGKPRLGK